MRVLLINAYAAGSVQGREGYEEFRQQVQQVIKEIERQDVTHVEVIEKSRNDLDEFLFEMHSEFCDPNHITNFDRLDFVFFAGDPSACPWAPMMRKLTLLVKMCMMTGKCLYGSGLGAGLLAFMCSTAGELVRVINNDGKGSLVDDVQAVPPPPPESNAVAHSEAVGTSVLLDTRSGDFFAFDHRIHAWVPRGNTGLMQHTSDHAHDYGARFNTARAGTKTYRSELGHALYTSKRGDTKCCSRLEAANHTIFTGLSTREFLINCKSTWDLDDRINSTGNNKYTVLLDSSRGPMMIKFGNCFGSHFVASKEYPVSCHLLRNFVLTKHEAFKVHEHIDRSYISAISGSARLKDRLQMASQTKTPPSAALASAREAEKSVNELPTRAATMASGKTSPKRCRPVSAGPYRTTPKPADAERRIQTSRSAYPSSGSTSNGIGPHCGGDLSPPTVRSGVYINSNSFGASNQEPGEASCNQREVTEATSARVSRPQTARAASARPRRPPAKTMELHPEVESPVVDEPASFPSLIPSKGDDTRVDHDLARPRSAVKAHRRIRVAQKNELEKPYCAIHKFNVMREQNKDAYYSVVNDAPYMSAVEREQLEHQKNKLRWTAGPFQSAVGKTPIEPEVGVFARTPFIEKNIPYHIIQRRQLEAPSPPRRQPRSGSPEREELQRKQHKKTRPMSAAATTRRPYR